VRENVRTGRTPRQVMEDARRALDAAGWLAPWGADADHLKSPDDLPPFVEAGYSFFTIDPSAYVDNDAGLKPLASLKSELDPIHLEEAESLYLEKPTLPGNVFDTDRLIRAIAKYARAIDHTVVMYRRLSDMLPAFDFEVSVDETDAPTTSQEHFYIAAELIRRGVHFTSLAPRFIGRFEKGVDYLGDLEALDAEIARHAAVTRHFDSYKISLHSGSDKFSVYPLVAKHWGRRLHVKTAGTSYLEALRTLAVAEPDLFRRIYLLALERYPVDRASYHVSADPGMIPAGLDLPSLLDDFHARQILHVTFGSALSVYGSEIRSALDRHLGLYTEYLYRHFTRHLELLE
jgi:hypothetical protein